MAGGASIRPLPQARSEEELRRKEVLHKSGNLTQIPSTAETNIEPINKKPEPKSKLEAVKVFFGMSEDPEVQSYEDYARKKQQPKIIDKLGEVVLDATDILTGAGKAIGSAAKKIKYELTTPRYEQEEDRKRGRKP